MALVGDHPGAWQWPGGGEVRIGSYAHKELFCRMLLDTYDPYKPAVIAWPQLDDAALLRLTSLPFWNIAVETEGYTSMRMQALADRVEDPLVREAIALNAFEERRHKEVLGNMIAFYGIALDDEPNYPLPRDAEWAYLRAGYGECFDSFFAFGLFQVARESGFFPVELVEVFEPVIQEEARHILFFANWAAYEQARKPLHRKAAFAVRRFAALTDRMWSRLKLAQGDNSNSKLSLQGHESMGIDLAPGSFMDLCLRENDRRMAGYDRRLLRPQVVPRLVRMARPFFGQA